MLSIPNYALPPGFESKYFRIEKRKFLVLYKIATGYLQVLESIQGGYTEYGLSLDPRGDRWAEDRRPENCVPVKVAIRPWVKEMNAKYEQYQLRYRSDSLEKEAAVDAALNFQTYDHLPDWPVLNARVVCRAAKKKVFLIDLNDYSCTCANKLTWDHLPRPRRFSQLCEHIRWAIWKQASELSMWDPALLEAIGKSASVRAFEEIELAGRITEL